MWQRLSCNFLELNLDYTLGGGQSFRWVKAVDGEWMGVISGHICSLKRDTKGNLLYKFHTPEDKNSRNENGPLPPKRLKKTPTKDEKLPRNNGHPDFKQILENYFNLTFPLEENYRLWGVIDENFEKVSKSFEGIRILRQDPVENLFSFICSANNNIPRITKMVQGLSTQFGNKIGEVNDHDFYTFPTIDRLAESGVEQKLRNMGFGYRAKYISQTAKILHDKKPDGWLEGLRDVPYEEAQRALISLPGVGTKVADCVCLMSLDKYEAVPIDTHVWQITVRDYFPKYKSAKTMTNQIYSDVGNFYRDRFGKYAGWANTVLFQSDLKMFKNKSK